MKSLALLALSLMPLLAGCPRKQKTQEAPPDYDAVRRHAEDAHKSLDSQKGE